MPEVKKEETTVNNNCDVVGDGDGFHSVSDLQCNDEDYEQDCISQHPFLRFCSSSLFFWGGGALFAIVSL